MKLSFGQWMKLGFGGLTLLVKHRAASPAIRALGNDAIDLWESVVPAEPPPEDGISHTEAIEKIRTGGLTPTEQAQFDRASQSSG